MQNKIIILLLLLPIISAAPSIEFQHQSIQPGETIFATITTSGEFAEQIKESQVKFFQGRKQVALGTKIIFYNNTHYLAIYTSNEENLTLQIENILYKEDGILKSATITQNLTIARNVLTTEETNETYTKILKIKPGAIFSTTTPKIRLTNTGTTQLNLTYQEKEISLSPMSSQEIEFLPKKTFSFLEISTYKNFQIPIVYLKASENTTFKSPSVKPELRPNPELLVSEAFTNNKTQETIELFNFGDANITNLQASTSMNFIKINELEDMPARGTQNLTIEIIPKTPGHFQGSVNVSFIQNETKEEISIPLSIFVLPEGTSPENFEVRKESCNDIGGEVCSSGTFCNGTTTFTKNAEYCCLESCIQTKSNDKNSSGSGWIIGLIILVALGGAGYYFYKKQNKFKTNSPQDPIKSSTEKFEKRINPTNSQRTTGNISKS